jgi:uncharacterized protein YukE
MSAGGNANRLASLTRELNQRWQQTREGWSDSKAIEFEERYMRGVQAAVQAAVGGMNQLESTLRKIRNDCE